MSRFNWDSETTFLKEKLPPDLLDRAKHASFLSKTINNEVNPKRGGDIDSIKSHVLNLNADWGAGKTYFLKRWAKSLKQDHPVVYIDAWSTDYLESPLITVLTELLEQLKEQTSKKDTQSAIEKADNVLKKAAPKVASAVMKKFLGFDLSVFSSDSEAEITDSKCNDASTPGDNKKNEINFAAAGEAILSQFYSEHKSHKQNVEALSKSIKDWVKLVKENPFDESRTAIIDYPAYIFIDELDRCKPTYAVEMLEAIKHVFDIPGLVFIVATNTKELQHTIKAVYGQGFNAESYLNRFFDSRYFIRTSLSKELLLTHCDTNFLESNFLFERELQLFPFVEDVKEKFLKFAVSLFNAFEITPREAIKITNRIKIIVLSLNVVKIDIVKVFTMLTLLHHKKSVYDELLTDMDRNKFDSKAYSLSELQKDLRHVYLDISNPNQHLSILMRSEEYGSGNSERIQKLSSPITLFSYFEMVFARRTTDFEQVIREISGLSARDIDNGHMLRLSIGYNNIEYDMKKYKDVVELASNFEMS